MKINNTKRDDLKLSLFSLKFIFENFSVIYLGFPFPLIKDMEADIMVFRIVIKELLNEILFSTNGRNYGLHI